MVKTTIAGTQPNNTHSLELENDEPRSRIARQYNQVNGPSFSNQSQAKYPSSVEYFFGVEKNKISNRIITRLVKVRRVPIPGFSLSRRVLQILAVCLHVAVMIYFYLNISSVFSIELTHNYVRTPAITDYQHSTDNSIVKQSSKMSDDTKPENDTITHTILSTESDKKFKIDDTRLLKDDYIYGRQWWETPTVIEEYKLIFFTIPKVGCTEWKTLFRKMMGMPPISPLLPKRHIQYPGLNNLTTLANYSLSDAEFMMKSPEWTKAVFVREPKERILSAFMNKFINDKFFFRKKCCSYLRDINATETCNRMIKIKSFEYFLNRTQDCKDFHWGLQANALDEKWWPSINFVGYMHSAANDARRLLESLVSVEDGASAWEKDGEIGWGDNGSEGFMQSNSASHRNGAQNKLKKYYTAENERFVEKHWAKDWNMHQYHFKMFHLFSDD